MFIFQLALACTLLCLFCTTNGWKSFEFETNEVENDYLNTKFIAPEFGIISSLKSGGGKSILDDVISFPPTNVPPVAETKCVCSDKDTHEPPRLEKRGLLRSIFGFWAAPHEVWFRHHHRTETEDEASKDEQTDDTICCRTLADTNFTSEASSESSLKESTSSETGNARLFPPAQSDIQPNSVFMTDFRQCPKLRPRFRGASSVHDVRPDEIKAIMSVGDSIMTGFGTRIKSLGDLWHRKMSPWTEYRGTSFAMGNDSDVTTLANLFSNYNPQLVGPSGGNHSWQVCWGIICGGVWTPSIDNLNAAQSGAMVMNLETQITYIIRQVRKYAIKGPLKLHRDFKFLTIWAGSNDMCVGCTSLTRKLVSPEKYGRIMRKILERVRVELPRTIVNLMATLRVSQVFEIDKNRRDCFVSRNFVLPFACPCAFVKGNVGNRLRERMDKLGEDYNKVLVDIVQEYQQKQDPNFAVIFDPGMSGMSLLKADNPPEFLSPLDCFHPSLKAHEVIASSAWNNLFRAAKDKNQIYDPMDNTGIFCPNEKTRIQTR